MRDRERLIFVLRSVNRKLFGVAVHNSLQNAADRVEDNYGLSLWVRGNVEWYIRDSMMSPHIKDLCREIIYYDDIIQEEKK